MPRTRSTSNVGTRQGFLTSVNSTIPNIKDQLNSIDTKGRNNKNSKSNQSRTNQSKQSSRKAKEFYCKFVAAENPVQDFRGENEAGLNAKLRRLEQKFGMRQLLNPDSHDTHVQTHLSRHEVTEVARARMVDWMFEVITAFKMSGQTFFLSV